MKFKKPEIRAHRAADRSVVQQTVTSADERCNTEGDIGGAGEEGECRCEESTLKQRVLIGRDTFRQREFERERMHVRRERLGLRGR